MIKISIFLLLALVFFEAIFLLFISFPKIQDAQSIKQGCSTKADKQTCYAQQMADLVKKTNFNNALKALSQLQKIDKQAQNCHLIAHYIALSQVNKNPGSWKNFLKQVSISTCNYGYIHGTFEALSRSDPKFNVNPESIPALCKTVRDISKSNAADDSCFHIMGHILLAQNISKNVEDGVRKTISQCNLLNDSSQKHNCYSGVFMESFTRDNLAVHWNISRINWASQHEITRQEELCQEYNDPEAEGCWQEISHMYTAFYNNSPGKVYSACSKAPTQSDINACYIHASGIIAVVNAISQKSYKGVCEPLDGGVKKECVENAALTIVSASPNLKIEAEKFCSSQTEEEKNCLLALKRV